MISGSSAGLCSCGRSARSPAPGVSEIAGILAGGCCRQLPGATIRHFWGSELLYAPTEPGQEYRHVGTIEPLWNLFDLTREGRGTDWDEQLSYS